MTTKRIEGVTGVTVGFDWVTLHFDGYDITVDKLSVSNQPHEATKAAAEERERKLLERIGELESTIKLMRDEVYDAYVPAYLSAKIGRQAEKALRDTAKEGEREHE